MNFVTDNLHKGLMT